LANDIILNLCCYRKSSERHLRPIRDEKEIPRRRDRFFGNARVRPGTHGKPVNNDRDQSGRRREPKHDRKENSGKIDDARDRPGRGSDAVCNARDYPAKPSHPVPDSDRSCVNERAVTEISTASYMSESHDTNLTQEQDKTSLLGEDEEEIIEEEEYIPDWIRCSPADLYFKREKQVNERINVM